MRPMPFSLVGLTLQELQNFMQRWNEPSYRGDQLAGWLYKTPVASFDEMTNISIRYGTTQAGDDIAPLQDRDNQGFSGRDKEISIVPPR